MRSAEVQLPPATEMVTIVLAAAGPGTACFDDLALAPPEGDAAAAP